MNVEPHSPYRELLRKQREFLLDYPWGEFPEEVDGILNLIDDLIDESLDKET